MEMTEIAKEFYKKFPVTLDGLRTCARNIINMVNILDNEDLFGKTYDFNSGRTMREEAIDRLGVYAECLKREVEIFIEQEREKCSG